MARRNQASVRDLIVRNRLAPPYRLQTGQRLSLPRPASHTVQPGETLFAIARRYGLTTTDLAGRNRLAPPYEVSVGQRLVISGDPAPPPRPGIAPEAAPKAAAAVVPRASPAAARKGFDWPLRGRVLSRFGAKRGGLRNDGINIAAAPGADVLAADDGVVAYAGNELRGFGNLVLIRHARGYTTAYAHNGDLLVRRGDRVHRGQVIARAGASGNVARAQLHFEIRRGTRAIDPITLLPRPISGT